VVWVWCELVWTLEEGCHLYASSTNRLAAVLTATTANRKVQRTISPDVIRFPPSLVDVVEMMAADVENPSEALLSNVAM